jgi:hypothetical protein
MCNIRGPDISQCSPQSAKDKTVNRSTVPEPHFVFCRMDIDVYTIRVQLKEQDVRRVASTIEDITVRLPDGMGNDLVFDHATIDEEVLQIRL